MRSVSLSHFCYHKQQHNIVHSCETSVKVKHSIKTYFNSCCRHDAIHVSCSELLYVSRHWCISWPLSWNYICICCLHCGSVHTQTAANLWLFRMYRTEQSSWHTEGYGWWYTALTFWAMLLGNVANKGQPSETWTTTERKFSDRNLLLILNGKVIGIDWQHCSKSCSMYHHKSQLL